MKQILSPQGMQILEALSFTKTLYAFDFDGTLAKIVTVPSDAHLNQQTEKLLAKLNSIAPVAVISGRSRTDLKSRIPKNIRYTVGNHGLEGISLNQAKARQTKNMTAQWKKELQ